MTCLRMTLGATLSVRGTPDSNHTLRGGERPAWRRCALVLVDTLMLADVLMLADLPTLGDVLADLIEPGRRRGARRPAARHRGGGGELPVGHKAVGNVPLLGKLGGEYDFTAEGVPLLGEDGATISSTVIRECLAAGDVAAASAALGRPHRVARARTAAHRRGTRAAFTDPSEGSPARRSLQFTSGHGHRPAAPQDGVWPEAPTLQLDIPLTGKTPNHDQRRGK